VEPPLRQFKSISASMGPCGLPVRPGEQDCAYFMRIGQCKYGERCKCRDIAAKDILIYLLYFIYRYIISCNAAPAMYLFNPCIYYPLRNSKMPITFLVHSASHANFAFDQANLCCILHLSVVGSVC
jgi:hypothetical protein